MGDATTDITSQEELSVCAGWIEDNMPAEDFLKVLHAKTTNAEAITCYLRQFLQSKNISFDKMRGLDGSNTMSGHRSGDQTRLRLHATNVCTFHVSANDKEILSKSRQITI